MRVVEETVEDGAAEGGIADDIVPVLDRHLPGAPTHPEARLQGPAVPVRGRPRHAAVWKYKIVIRRRPPHPRLRDAVYHWARVAVPARPRQEGQVRRPVPPGPQPRPCIALSRRPPARRRLRDAHNPDPLYIQSLNTTPCTLIPAHFAGLQPHCRTRCQMVGSPLPWTTGRWIKYCPEKSGALTAKSPARKELARKETKIAA